MEIFKNVLDWVGTIGSIVAATCWLIVLHRDRQDRKNGKGKG